MFIKVSFANNTRKIRLEDNGTLTALKLELVRCFGEKVKELGVGYMDNENELITVANEEDWQVCVEEFKEKNKGKPALNITIQLIPVDEFVTVSDVKENKTESISVVVAEPEIKEEPSEVTTPMESFPEDKIIQEVKPEEIVQPETEEVEEYSQEVEVEIPVEGDFSKPEDLQNLIDNVSNTLGSLFGIKVDVLEARLEQPPKQEETLLEQESMNSTLTYEMKNEIESLIEEKVSKMLNMKKATTEPKKQNFIHTGITCDGCRRGIHNMARYKSLIKDDYDLCEECERKGLHPGPMVRFSEPSIQNNWNLNHKFREIRSIFATETNTPKEDTNEGFRFPRNGGCPFRGGRRGPKHCQRNQQNQSNEQTHPTHQLPSFLQSIINGGMGGPLDGLLKLIPVALEKLNKPTAAPQAQPTATANTTETIGDEKTADSVKKLALEAHEVLPNVSPCILEAIIRENNFKSVEEILNYLL